MRQETGEIITVSQGADLVMSFDQGWALGDFFFDEFLVLFIFQFILLTPLLLQPLDIILSLQKRQGVGVG
jgi:hypothetical protein